MNSPNGYSIELLGEAPTVLVVEDEALIRSVLVQFLSGHGFRVRQASDGADAMQLATGNSTIHLLLTDFAMPGMDGLELIHQFRALRPATPVLLVSGSIPLTDCRFKHLDAFDTLAKPFEFEELLRKVRRMLRGAAGTAMAAA
jgi:DNA-binding response OmpR family regulator